MSNPTATPVGGLLASMRGAARLYRLSEPLEGNYFVIASTVDEQLSQFTRVHETYIFGADSNGKVTDWGELPGSLKNTSDHEEALREAGYAVLHEAVA